MITPLSFSLASIFLSLLTFGVLYAIYKLVVVPYLNMLYYKRQGVDILFHKTIIPLFKNQVNARKHGDCYLTYKQFLKDKPDTKAFVENFGPGEQLILLDPNMIKEYLKRYETYHKPLDDFGLFAQLVAGSVIFAEDQAWKKRRRMVTSAFNFDFLKHVVPVIINATQESFNSWIAKDELRDINIIEKLGNITGEITGRFVFGKNFQGKKLRNMPITTGVQKLITDLAMEHFSLPVMIFGPKLIEKGILPKHKQLLNDVREIRQICQGMIKETEMNQEKENNLLNLLLEFRHKGNPEERLTDEDILGEFIGLFGAGTDTTSHLVGSAIYFLYRYPNIFEKVKKEVDEVFGEDLRNVDIERINKMSYTTAFLKEALRCGGPTGCFFTRRAVKEDDLCGIKVKKGTMVNIYHELFYSSEKYYSNPQEFAPERWLEDSFYSKDGVKGESYAFLPFSAGPRNCLGQHLGMIEARILIGLFIKTFNFSFPENYKFIMMQRFTYEPLDPLLISLKPIHEKE